MRLAKRTSVLGLRFLYIWSGRVKWREKLYLKPNRNQKKSQNGCGFISAVVLSVWVFQYLQCFKGVHGIQKSWISTNLQIKLVKLTFRMVKKHWVILVLQYGYRLTRSPKSPIRPENVSFASFFGMLLGRVAGFEKSSTFLSSQLQSNLTLEGNILQEISATPMSTQNFA